MTQTSKIKSGTRIKVEGSGVMGEKTYEFATIKRSTKNDQLPTGYYPVRFDADGGTLCVHESRFVVLPTNKAPKLDQKEKTRLDRKVKLQNEMLRLLTTLMAQA